MNKRIPCASCGSDKLIEKFNELGQRYYGCTECYTETKPRKQRVSHSNFENIEEYCSANIRFSPIPTVNGTITESCWIWIGPHIPTGYGICTFKSQSKLAHRIVYEIFNGQIPEGMVLDHLCRIKPCVNPDHLEIVTINENARRTWIDYKPQCRAGHIRTSENTILVAGKTICLICEPSLPPIEYESHTESSQSHTYAETPARLPAIGMKVP